MPLLAILPVFAALAMAPTLTQAAGKAPVCKILSPRKGTVVNANQDVTFQARAALKDKSAGPLKYEWDFAGGVFGESIPNTNPQAYKRPDGLKTTVQFVRNDALFRVHFSATDTLNRRCDAFLNVSVGKPPKNLPNVTPLSKASQKSSPPAGSPIAGQEGDLVILPYPELTMQAHPDARYININHPGTIGPFNSINAMVYQKSRKPVAMTSSRIDLQYSAASSKTDPAGTHSINATSQNFPLVAAANSNFPLCNDTKNANPSYCDVAPWQDALIQKTDAWEVPLRAADELPTGYPAEQLYMANSWMDANSWMGGGPVKPDEGFRYNPAGKDFPEHGSYMPGIESPYTANAYQDFTRFESASHTFSASNIPVTDIDDSGRVNPYPLMRVQAVDPVSKSPLPNASTTDTVVSIAKDFHCSECHAKGKIAANANVDYASFTNAYHSSPEYNQGYYCTPPTNCKDDFKERGFFDPVDQQGQPSDHLADKEYAAIRNAAAIHDFYDYTGMNYSTDGWRNDNDKSTMDMSASCTWCHKSMIDAIQLGGSYGKTTGKKSLDMMYYPSLSESMHRFHSQLQLDPNDKSKILRKADGRPLLWNYDAQGSSNPNTLFPTVDNNGKSLPMEESCLRCHSGHREQLYRDRMFTAGVTCYDCHGDMAAVGQAFANAKPGPEGEHDRVEWMSQPDCGSCHMGDGNVGKNNPEAFSAGVMRRAFNGDDPSATTRKPMTQRFAVQAPLEPQVVTQNDTMDPQYSTRYSLLTLTQPLYRKSRDTHGDVACAACHGGAHEVWENRDPKANDNVTALQLQGHTGTVLECGVCHTADAFKSERDLDGGVFMTDLDTDSGVLGGPHNMHPVDDPYWWKSSNNSADVNSDKTTYGGWHNNYAKKPGKHNEDQCAACHGKDHKGTRLSKTPVARIFSFKGFDKKKLAEAGINKTTIKVAAGTQIGCDTCHSVETSCIGSPAGEACGVESNEPVFVDSNRDPVITQPITHLTAVMGEAYSDRIQASDPDQGDMLSYSLSRTPKPITDDAGIAISELKIDAQGQVSGNLSDALFAGYKHGPFTLPYVVTVSDGKGGYAVQNVEVTLECPAGKHWQWTGGQWDGSGGCKPDTGITIASQPAIKGIEAGATTYSYQVVANTDPAKLPVTYAITDSSVTPGGSNWYANGIAIDANTGLVTWESGAKTVWYGQAWYQVKATNKNGEVDTQVVTVTVCVPNKTWDEQAGVCK
jgi:hypothetical protein